MRKTLVFHLYVSDDYETNIAYKIHEECLRVFNYLFDNIKITIALDDLNNKDAINWAFQWINNVFCGFPMEITVVKNSPYREGSTFKEKVLNNQEDDLVFFFHSKGITNFANENLVKESIFNWICGIYYFNLYDKSNAIDILETGTKAMCGAFLVLPPKEDVIRYKPFFAGTGYWINLRVLRNLIKCGVVKDLECSDRFFAEKYPGTVLNVEEEWGLEGAKTTKLLLGPEDGAYFYTGTKEDWDKIINIYEDNGTFADFVEYIGNKVGFTPYNNKI